MFSILLMGIVTILAIGMMGTVSALDQTITTSSSGGLKTAINDVGIGQTVYMENGVYSGNDNNGIIINKSLTIQGKGNNVVIDAKGTNRIFIIESGAKVSLKNLKLINGKSPDRGGVIYNNGSTLSVSTCTFTNNQANNGDGGAIYNERGTLSISSSTFTNNKATINGIVPKDGLNTGGGAIYSIGNLTVSDSTFTNNQASNGGAIYIGGSLNIPSGYQQYLFVLTTEIVVSISGSTFENNRAENTGGAISHQTHGGALSYCNSTLSITGSIFNNNKAGYGGSAIYNYAYFCFIKGGTIYANEPSGVYDYKPTTKLIIQSSTFNNNEAGVNSKGSYSNGGAIYANSGSEIKIDKTSFKNNIDISTNTYGTIVYTGTKLTKTSVTITPTDGTKVGAGASNSGGTTNTGVTVTTKLADLKITKITKKGSYRYVFVKNIGKASAGKNTLGVYIGKTLIKKVTVKSIGIGKTLKVKVAIPKKYTTKKYKNMFKAFKVDIKNIVKESNKKNNIFKAK